MSSNQRALPALGLASMLALAGCAGDGVTGSDQAGESQNVGQVGLSLMLPDGSLVDEVEYRLLRFGELVRSGTAPVQDDGST